MRNHPAKAFKVFALKPLLFFWTFFILLPFTNGQSAPSRAILKPQIKGQVIDGDTEKPLDYATITLFQVSDSSMVTGVVTDISGAFRLEPPEGNFYLVLEFIGYKNLLIPDIKIEQSNPLVDLGVIKLFPDATTLNEIEVRAEKSQMQLALDKRVFNVGKDLANIGGSAEDILDNVPSVTVDVEGQVSLRGSQNLRILIDGRPSGLVGADNANGLRSLPANMIDRIEVITNPSARYEAEGMAGIINIILKKNKKKGLNGAFDFNVGYPERYGTALNLNYRRKNFNFFANYGLSYRESPGSGSRYQEVYQNDTTLIQQNTRERLRTGISNSFRFGSDYTINEHNTITAALTYRISDEDNISTLTYNDFLFNLDNPTAITIRTDNEKEDEIELEYALNYKRTFKRKGQELTALLRYEENTETEASNIIEEFFDAENVTTGVPDLLQRSNNEEGDQNWLIQVDYVHPFAEEGKFEIGIRGSFRDILNDYIVEQLDNGEWFTFGNFDNNFDYDENISALYSTFGNKVGKFSYQLGLRAEHSDVDTRLITTGEENSQNYFNLFPSAHITYDLPSENAVQVSYSRRIRRPSFRELNPFTTFSDARNLFSGNPNLQPEFTHSLEAGHIKYWDDASFSSSIYYRHTEGVVQRIRTINETGDTTNLLPVNLSTEDAFGFEFNFSVSPVKWWKLSGDANFYRVITEGSYLDAVFSADTYTLNGRMTSRMTLWKKIDAQLRINYRAPRQTPQGSNRSYTFMDFGANKDIFKGKGTITLSVSDIFNSRRWRYTTFGENFITEGDFQWRARQVTLTLNYRLNQKKQRGGRGGGDRGGNGGMF